MKIKVKPINWIKFRGERDGPSTEERRVAKAENPVGPDKEAEMVALLQNVSRRSGKSNTCCLNRIFINNISTMIMLHFAGLDRIFTIEMFMEESSNLLPGIYLCP